TFTGQFINAGSLFVFRPKLIVTEGTRLLREYASEGRPAGADRPGKRVPVVEINVKTSKQ
ncbi:hypothetical protein J7E55_24345, partial [Bacillus sp. ISL-53]|nr:hypothetical protein [Bacillus sp. ISL-53]